MNITFKNYTIEIIDDATYAIQSSFNASNYKFEYNNGKINTSKIYTIYKRGIRITDNTSKSEYASAILFENGGKSDLTEGICSIEGGKLFTCVGDKLYNFNMPNLEVNWFKTLNFGTLHTIQPFKDDLIIHGELGIMNLNHSGEIKWKFMGGGGIFTPGKGKLKLSNSHIEVKDGNDRTYILDEFSVEQ